MKASQPPSLKGSVMFINRVYPPDEASTGQILAELTEGLVEQGWQVTVICSHTQADTPLTEERNGVFVQRVKGIPFTRASHIRRALSYLSLYPSLLWRAMRQPRHDIVVTMTDPPLQLLLGLSLRWFRGCQLVHWAQDVYPELAEHLGVIPEAGILARALRWLSTFGLKQYHCIVVIGRCMQQCLLDRGIPNHQLMLIRNWADTKLIYPVARKDNNFLARHNIPLDTIIVAYSGNMGMAHPFEAIVAAMKHIQVNMPQVLFLFIGDGPRCAWLKSQVSELQLTNVRFLPYQDKTQLAHSLSAADVHLVCMQRQLNGLVVPSKAYGIMAAGRPMVYLGPEQSEVALQIKESGCGWVVNDDPASLTQALTMVLRDQGQNKKAGKQGRVVAEQMSVIAAIQSFDHLLTRLSSNTRVS